MKRIIALTLLCASLSSFGACETHYYASKKPSTSLPGVHLCRLGYEVYYSKDKKASLYAAEYLTPSQMTKQESRKDDFRPDPELRKGERAELKDWNGSGFDRGHLAPAEDMRADPKKLSQSFLLSNIVMQEPAHNQNIWRRLELSIAKRVRAGEDAYVLTGPSFSGEDERVGRNQVAVPKTLWKVVYWPKTKEHQAWVIPNHPDTARNKPDQYLTTVSEIEKLTNLKLQ